MNDKSIAMRFAYGDALLELAPVFPEMVVLDADVSSSTRTAAFGKQYSERFFNVGVAEANMVDIAAGMATCGLRPIVNTFALFIALKCTDQIRNIVCYNNLPVIFAGNYAGLSDSYDGASHQSILDISIMRSMPNMAVVVPADGIELHQVLEDALRRNGPTFIRICRNPSPLLFSEAERFQFGKIRKLRDGSDITIAVCGIPTSMAIDASKILADRGINVDLLEVSTIKPIDANALNASAKKTGKVLTIEEHTTHGGFGSAIAEILVKDTPVPMRMIGVEDTFTESGDYSALLNKYGISTNNIVDEAIKLTASGIN